MSWRVKYASRRWFAFGIALTPHLRTHMLEMAVCENLGKVAKKSSVVAFRATRAFSVCISSGVQWYLSPTFSQISPVSSFHNSHCTVKPHKWFDRGLSIMPLQNTIVKCRMVLESKLFQSRLSCSMRDIRSGRGMYFEG